MAFGDEKNLEARIQRLEKAVETLYRQAGLSFSADPGSATSSGDGYSDSAAPEQDPELLELVQRGKNIQAIKRYRDLTGAGLKEAKSAVERLSG